MLAAPVREALLPLLGTSAQSVLQLELGCTIVPPPWRRDKLSRQFDRPQGDFDLISTCFLRHEWACILYSVGMRTWLSASLVHRLLSDKQHLLVGFSAATGDGSMLRRVQALKVCYNCDPLHA